MALRKGTPGKGAKVDREQFRYTPVANGTKGSFSAYLAGPIYWALAHEHTPTVPHTKPCLDWMTEGQLRCPRCKPFVVPTWIGWVPLYRELDHKPIIVIIHESVMDLVAKLEYPASVLVGRMDDKSSVFVRKSDNAMSFKTENELRKKPVDVTPDLLWMWQLPALDQWLLDQRAGRLPAPVKSDGEPFSSMTSAAAQRYGCDGAETASGSGAVDDAQRRMLARVQASGTNGNGKHKPR